MHGVLTDNLDLRPLHKNSPGLWPVTGSTRFGRGAVTMPTLVSPGVSPHHPIELQHWPGPHRASLLGPQAPPGWAVVVLPARHNVVTRTQGSTPWDATQVPRRCRMFKQHISELQTLHLMLW